MSFSLILSYRCFTIPLFPSGQLSLSVYVCSKKCGYQEVLRFTIYNQGIQPLASSKGMNWNKQKFPEQGCWEIISRLLSILPQSHPLFRLFPWKSFPYGYSGYLQEVCLLVSWLFSFHSSFLPLSSMQIKEFCQIQMTRLISSSESEALTQV